MSSIPGCTRRRLVPMRGARPLLRGAAVLALLATACDYPTSSPKWYTEWMVPVRNTRIASAQFLPPSVTMVADSSAFLVAMAPTTMVRTLGQLCSACAEVTGSSAPKPAFSASLGDTIELPSDVAGAALVGGTVTVAVTNGFGFDPLRPSASARGSLTITLTSGSVTVGSLALSGTDTALPPGGTITRDVALANGQVGNGIVATLTLTSPAGDAVWIDATQGLTVTATPRSVRVTSVSVSVHQKPVSVDEADLDLSNIDQSLIDRVHGGSLVVDLDNPFAVTGTVTLTISGGALAAPIAKPIAVSAGQTTQKLDFSLPELQSMLGRAGLVVRGNGLVSATAPVALTPWQAVGITTELDLIVGPKEN